MNPKLQFSFSELGLINAYPFASQDPVLVDVGGHEGGVSRVFAQKGWRVIAFEPEEVNRTQFLKNLSNFETVTCLPYAVTHKADEKITFYTSTEHYGIHSIQPFHKTHQAAYEVETTTINKSLEKLEIEHISFLKVDTEGADYLALQGTDFQKYKPELVMIEFMDERSLKNFQYDHHEVANYMKKQGYACYVSEWDEIKEYGRKGVASDPHSWLQCVSYPLDHAPAWGNLIFVPEEKSAQFEKTLQKYLAYLIKGNTLSSWQQFKNLVKRIPGTQKLIDFIKGN